MNALLKWTGIGKLTSFYRYIYFNQSKLITTTGIALILLVGLIHLLESPEYFEAAIYLGLLFLANFAGTVVAAIGIFRGACGWGWALGALISGVTIAVYLVSRTLGLPGYTEGMWADPVGSFSVMVEGLFVALYLSIVTGMNIAYPDKREWHD
jgi:hypothetical protein